MPQIRRHLQGANPTTILKCLVCIVLMVLFFISESFALTGDIDGSGRVDGNDLIIFSQAFNTSSGEVDFLAAADINGDDTVDNADLALLTEHFGFTGRSFNLWVADTSGNRIVRLSDETGRELAYQANVYGPVAVSVNNRDGSVWVADTLNNRVLKLSPVGDIELHITGFNRPASVSVDEGDGSCWVADTNNHRIVKLLPQITDNYDLTADTGSHVSIYGFTYPQSVSVDSERGTCWVADTSRDRVVRLSADIADGYDLDAPPLGVVSHTILTGFDDPVSVSVNPVDGKCWVADYRHHAIVKVSETNTLELLRLGGFQYPRSVSVNPDDGSCWVADTSNNEVVHLSSEGIELSRTGGFNSPYSVSVNPYDGSCWVADRSNNQAVKVLLSGAEVLRVSNFNNPQGVALYMGAPPPGEPMATATISPLWADVGQTVTFEGTAQDSDGTIALYEWDFEGDGTFDFQSTESGITTHVYDAEGIFSPVFRAIDDNGRVGIHYGDLAHIGTLRAIPGADVTSGPAPLLVTFTADFYDPEDMRIASYAWDFDGDGLYDYQSDTTGNTTFTYNSPGLYTAVLKVIDDDLTTATAFVAIDVLSSGPVVSASATPSVGTPPLTVDFVGTATDDGSVMLYQWDFDGDGAFDWVSTQGGAVTHRYETTGTYQAVFQATDNDGLHNADSVTISANFNPTVEAIGAPQKGNVGMIVDFDCTVGDVDGSIVLYEWDYEGDGTYDQSSPDTCVSAHTYPTAGTHNATLRVTDNGGGSATDSLEIIVLPTGYPVATATVVPDSGYIPLDSTFTGTATDAGGFIVQYEWSFGDEPGSTFFDDMEAGVGTWSADPPWALDTSESHSGSTSWTDSPGGDYDPSVEAALTSPTFDFSAAESPTLEFWHRYNTEYSYDYCRVEVSDDDGTTWTQIALFRGDSGGWNQQVYDLSAYVGSDQVRIRFRLSGDGDANVGDGWYIDDVRVAGIRLFPYQSATTGNTSHTYQEPGTYFPIFRITDNDAMQDTVRLEVNVDPGIPSAVAEASPVNGLVPLTVDLTADNSSDPNGTLDEYRWYIKENEMQTLNEDGYPTTMLFLGPWNTTGCNDYTKHQTGIENEMPIPGDVFGDRTWFAASDADGIWNLNSTDLFGPSINKYAYAFINLYSPEAQPARVKLGSDDTSRFWLNGQLVYTKTYCGSVVVDQNSFDVSLQQGWNPVLVAVYQGTGGFGLTFRFTDQDDRPLRLPYLASSMVGGAPDYSSTATGNTPYALTKAGIYPATLQVIDNDGYSDYDTVLIKAQAPPQLLAVRPEDGRNVSRDAIFQVDATDEDGHIALYEWDFDGDGVYDYISSTSGDTFHTYPLVGTYTPSVRVTDDDGLTAQGSVTIHVVNLPPEISAISASPVKGSLPLQVTFAATASDPDGRLTAYNWDFDGDGVADRQSTSGADAVYTYTAAGTYQAMLQVIDNSGQSASRSVTIQVNESGAPLVTAAASPANTYTGKVVRLNVESTESATPVIRYEWDVDGDGTFDTMDNSAGSVVAFSSQYNTTTWAAENLIDGKVGSDFGWRSAYNPGYPIDLTFAFQGQQILVIDRIAVNPYTPSSADWWVKDFELQVSETGQEPSDFTSVGTYTLQRSGQEQFFAFPPVSAKFIKLRILSSQNVTTYAEIGEVKVFAPGSQDNLLAIDGTTYHAYSASGLYHPAVRVLNATGLTDTDDTQVVVNPIGEDAPKTWIVDRYHDQLVKLSSNGDEILRTGGFSDPYSVDVYQGDGSVWVGDLGTDDVIKLDSDGVELLRATNFNDPYKVSVDQGDGSVWVASDSQNELVKLAADGTELLRIGGRNRPISVDVNNADHSAWLVEYNANRATRYAQDGTLLATVTGFSNPRDVAVHPLDGTVWIADRSNDRVVRLADSTPDNYDVNLAKVTVAADASGNGYDGALVNDAKTVPEGRLNNGIQFDGDGDYVRISYDAGYRPTDAVTAEAWIYANDWSIGDQALVSMTENGGWNFSTSGMVLRFVIEIDDTYVEAGVASSTVPTGEWHHLAGVYDGAAVNLYIDGVLQATTPATGSITYHPSNALLVGAEASSYTNAAGSYFFGKIDELRIWGRALDAAEIQANLTQELVGPQTALLAYYRFNEAIGPFHHVIGGFKDPVFLDVNRADGSCWVSEYSDGQLVQISEGGDIELARVGGYYQPHMPAVNPMDGTVWIPDYSHNQVVKLSPVGSEILRNGGYYQPSAAAIDIGLRTVDQPPMVTGSASPVDGDAPLTVTFTGSATDNGSVVSYEWDFQGDGIYDYSSADSADTVFTYNESGVYRPVLRVMDNDNLVAYAYTLVRVGDFILKASATPDKGAAPLSVSFTATAAAIDGLITLYEWDFDGDGVYDWSSSTTGNVSNRLYQQSGLYLARLRVTDSTGQTAKTAVPIAVTSTRPVARATVSPVSGSYPLTVNLTDNASYDNDGSIVRYEWDYDGDGVFDYSSTTQGSTSFVYTGVGIFYPTLKVTDNDGFSSEDRKVVTVHGAPPAATASASPLTGNVPLLVNFNGTGVDADGSVVLYEWSFGDYRFLSDDVEGGNAGWSADAPWSIVSSDAHSPSHSWTESPGGLYENNLNASLVSAVLDFTDADAPMLSFYHRYDFEENYDYGFVEILDADGAWQVVASFTGASETWERTRVDLSDYAGNNFVKIRFRVQTDGFFVRDGWYVDDIRVLDEGYFSWQSPSDGVVDHLYTETGEYKAQLRVTDETGLASTDAVHISVIPAGAPTADIQATPDSGGKPLFVTLDPSASSDVDGTIVAYQYDFGDQIEVKSAGYYDGNFCEFHVNDTQVGTNNRGYNFVVLDEENLNVLEARSFDTNGSTTAADEMADFVRSIPIGRVVLVAIKDEAINRMNANGHRALESLGSTLTRDVGYRDSWALIGVKGSENRAAWEAHAPTGTGSVTVNGGILSFSSAVGDPVMHTYRKTGKFVARLRVTDDDALMDEDLAEISIGNPKALPRAYPPAGMAPLTVNFICNGEDVDGTLEYFKWDFDGNGTFDSTSRRSDTVQHTFNAPGTYHSRLQVIDNDGLIDEADITIVVTDESTDGTPVAEAYASPSNGTTPLTVSLRGYGTDRDGTLQQFEWDFDGDGIYDWSSPNNGITQHTYAAPGLFPARFRVTDNNGLQGIAIVLVNVYDLNAPVITAAVSSGSGSYPLTVDFSGTAHSDENIVLYEWDFDGDGTYDYSSATSADVTHQYNTQGVYYAVLRVTDDLGIQSTHAIRITVGHSDDLRAIRSNESFDPTRGQVMTISTALSFPVDAFTLRINDASGTTVRVLVDEEARSSGLYTDVWDGRDSSMQIVDSGVYFFVVDYTVDGQLYHYDLTGDSGSVVTITPTYSTVFIPIEDKFLTATFSLSGPAEITTYVSPFSGGAGNRIRTIHLRSPRKSGTQVIAWDGVTDEGTLAPLNQNYVMAVFAYGLSGNALIVASNPLVTDVNTDPDFFNPDNLYDPVDHVGVQFNLFKDADVTVSIYDENMYLIRRWTEQNLASGQHVVQWDGRNIDGRLVAPGHYRVGLKAMDNFGNSSKEANGLIEIFY